MDAVTTPPPPVNEPIGEYAPGSPERAEILAALQGFADPMELPAVIAGESRMPAGEPFEVRAPHDHARVLGISAHSTGEDARYAVTAALAAARAWRETPFDERAAVLLRAADLLAGPWRARLNAATMLGQAKTVYQAEIDAACELIDFWRYNVHFARQILAEQPVAQARGTWNRTDHRPLEGFVYAVTPFNFTAIAGNLPTAPALMGNVVIWKPSPTQQLAASLTLQILREAGLPDGVITLLPGQGPDISDVLLADPNLAGIHFTGSTAVFQQMWRTVGENIAGYRSYPRLVGETGGKDFVVAHASADVDAVRTALIRGAFEYSGQKCSAASRAFVPESMWPALRDDLIGQTEALAVGDVEDLGNFTSAVIDGRSFRRLAAAIDRAHATDSLEVLAGGTYDDSVGWFVRPTLLLGSDVRDEAFCAEYFGPILSLSVYPDDAFDAVLREVDSATPYALTGSILARDRAAVQTAGAALRFAAGNFYVNDKPTGAVVGQQPFGGGRASGTNDKAGSAANLLRWTSPRSIKETFVPPTAVGHPHQR
ncbi:L-glutamate gamma-semialdehyde dehydrogenase [Nakamurella flavida]|uniref:L-glutamate gamma-semialdehyde dehydrogenase n=1 Tax=Nakamurella flavida TaxID=363630 RepID=A0A938YHG9_9ACTN|nr:L-glutamate gamma-semialdehyde dehydrogenase [Nakamurella flavida]MBM9477771.1 L-glutamate gamma-semialdehyde dehydrogenase [Nakamurella flavida]MDP9779323.1 1-pyrroline-5-carboxylate dehydrogenase [Nakamurella flavida]